MKKETHFQLSSLNSPLIKPGYKQTEVGVIPEDWEVKRLGEIAAIATGCTPSTRDASNYGDEFLFVSPVDMGDTKFISQTEKMLSKKGFLMSRRFPPDSILFVCIGSTIGKCGIAPVELTSNQQINAIFPSTNFSTDYLFYAVSASAPQIRAQAGEQAVPIVNKTQFSETTVGFPPSIEEQRAIATALSDVDALLDGLNRLIAKKRDIKEATMQQLLTGKTRLPGFTSEWETKRLGDHVAFLRNGVNSRAELTLDGPVKYLHYGDIHSCANVMLDPIALPSLPLEKAKTLDRLRDGDLVFVDASEDLVGVSKFVEIPNLGNIELVAGLHTISARFDKAVLADGFKAYLQFCPAFSSHLRRLAAGTKVYATNRSHIASVEMRLPGVEEQAAIATVLLDMDAEITTLEARRDKTKNIKQAMMQELLTGRTRLSDFNQEDTYHV